MPGMDTGPWRTWVALVGAVCCVAAAASACWLQASFVGWLTAMGVLVILLIVVLGYDQPGRYLLGPPYTWFVLVAGLVGLASAARLGRLGWPHVSTLAMGGLVVTLVVLAFVLWGLREPARVQVQDSLVFPLRSGTWVVAAGGMAALNHHLVVGAQTGALDLIALRDNGTRAVGTCPRDLGAYAAYRRRVVSPCDGVVTAVVDGQPETARSRADAHEPLGNHVRIESASETVCLAHLRPGSVLVAVGEHVVAGQSLGEVGRSGRTSEPSLHVHAERGGVGLRLRFVDVPSGRLRPGVPIRVAERVQPHVDS